MQKSVFFNVSPRIALIEGKLAGHVSKPGWTFGEQDLTSSWVKVFQNGRLAADSAVDADGTYVVNSLTAGDYDMLVYGKHGFAAMAFTATDVSIAKSNSTGQQCVARRGRSCCPALACELIQLPKINTCCEPLPVCGCGSDPCSCNAVAAAPVAEVPAQGAPVAIASIGGTFGNSAGFYGGGGFGSGGGFGGGGGAIGGGFGGAAGLLGVAGLAVGVAALADDDDGFNGNLATPIAR